MRREFTENGFVVLPRLLAADAVQRYSQALAAAARRRRVRSAALRGCAWTLPDGVTQRSDFWPLIFHEGLLAAVREILGPDVRYLPHSDLHVGFSAAAWHRDNVNRTFGSGPDWDESREPYRLVRVGFYLQRPESGFVLGLVPGSHRPGLPASERLFLERTAGWTGQVASVLLHRDRLARRAAWIGAASGDAVLFDPRVLHAGRDAKGPKYSLFLGYGVVNGHFHRHRSYYRHLRSDLGYADMPPELVERLRTAGLLALEQPAADSMEEAWIPPSIQAFLGRRLR
jgi:Phytanoyl-CoA dioxygenase (PhyH)